MREVRVGLRPGASDGDAPILGALPASARTRGVRRAGHGATGLLLGPVRRASVADPVLWPRSQRSTSLRFSPARFTDVDVIGGT